MRKSIDNFIIDPATDININKLKSVTKGKKYENIKEDFAKIPFSHVNKLLCRGRNLILTLWILEHVDLTVERDSPWFYVAPNIVERYNIDTRDWYRSVDKLSEMNIIRIRRRAGFRGRNLYCFTDKLPGDI